jgi:hypothetical protein
MAETTTESAPVETPDESTLTVDTDVESIGQNEESPASEQKESEGEPSSDAAPDPATDKRSSEERATETAKRQAIEIRNLKREHKQLQEQMKAFQPKVQELTPPQRPKLEDFYAADDPNQAYGQAIEKFEKSVQEFAVEKDHREQAARANQAEADKQRQADQKAWNKRQAETLKRTPDYVFADAVQDVNPTAIMDGFILESEIGPDLLWHLKENPDVADKLRDMKPYLAVREMIKLEDTLSNEIKGIKPKAPNSRPLTAIRGGAAGISKQRSAEDILYR